MSNAKIEPLRIAHGDNGAELQIERRSPRWWAFTLEGHGFEVYRLVSSDDLREICDWINTALASVEPHTEETA